MKTIANNQQFQLAWEHLQKELGRVLEQAHLEDSVTTRYEYGCAIRDAKATLCFLEANVSAKVD